MCSTSGCLVVAACQGTLLGLATLGEKLLIPLFIEMRYGNPGVRHFVTRAAAAIYPLIRIRVVGVIGCVVVPLLDHHNLTWCQQRCHVRFVDVAVMPSSAPV